MYIFFHDIELRSSKRGVVSLQLPKTVAANCIRHTFNIFFALFARLSHDNNVCASSVLTSFSNMKERNLLLGSLAFGLVCVATHTHAFSNNTQRR